MTTLITRHMPIDRNRWRRELRALASALVIAAALLPAGVASGAGLQSTTRRASSTAVTCAANGDLDAYFSSDTAPLRGDYQRTVVLPDGRVIWTFQDAFVRDTDGASVMIHNAGLVQTGSCFRLLRGGTSAKPTPWILANETIAFQHWFWPLDAAMDNDGNLRVFLAEMRERGDHYLAHVEPVATWIATVRSSDLSVISVGLAPNPSASLFGWSITSDLNWTYLYGYCDRQFGWSAIGHDLSCSADVRLGRVRRGHLDAPPTYWNGTTWTPDASAAVAVMPRAGRVINPAQVHWTGNTFVAVSKVGDWYGATLYVDIADHPQGPWTPTSATTIAPLCATCVTYFASVIARAASTPSGELTIGVSNNTWDGHQLRWYHPTFVTISGT